MVMGLNPLLENHGHPYHGTVITGMGILLMVQNVIEISLAHPAAAGESRQAVADQFAQWAVRNAPWAKGQTEAMFALVDDLFRKQVAQCLLEEPAQLQALDQILGRQMSGKSNQTIVQQGE